MASIREWLLEVGLEQCAPAFLAQEITPEVLPDLTASDIERLALPQESRHRLLIAIQSLRGESAHTEAYVPPRDPSSAQSGLGHGAERRQLTVMFCDLVG